MRTLALAALLLAACASAVTPPTTPPPAAAAPAAPLTLAGTRWIGVVDASVDASHAPRLEFIEGRMQGFTGCNMMSGAWRMEGGEVRLGAIAATRRMCVGPGGDIEKRVLAALGDKSRVWRDGDRLVIEAPGGARFEFREAKAA